MAGLSESELLLYGGIAVMIVTVVLSVICTILFWVTGRKIKRKLTEEYGKPIR